MSVAISVRDLRVSYGEITALQGIDLDVQSDEITAVIGPNGAGKTTLLRAISGLVDVRGGDITHTGDSIVGLPPYEIVERGIIQVPEGRELFGQMTVLENLRFGAYNDRSGDRDGRLANVFDLFPRLEERQNQRADTLSGGEAQMLAIGRGLMADPEILLLDEPSLGLAPELVNEVIDTIEEINQRGVTVLLVEQKAMRALDLASHIYILKQGRIDLHDDGEAFQDREDLTSLFM